MQTRVRTELRAGTHRALLLRGLHTARPVVTHAAGRVLLALTRSMDETMHLRVLAHARRELGTQVNEGLLRGGQRTAAAGPRRAQGPAPPRPALPSPGPALAPPCPALISPGTAPPRPLRAPPRPHLTGPRPAPPSSHWTRPCPALPRPHRAGPDPEVLLLHVLDILIDPTVAQHLGGGKKDKTELGRAPSRQSG